MVLRLMPCSPRRRIRFVTVASGLRLSKPGWADFASARLDISNGCQDHTVLPYATSAVRPARRDRSRVQPRPATTLRADAAASTASHPAFVTIAKRPSCRERTGRAGRTDLPDGESEIFFLKGLDRFLSQRLICPSGRFVAPRIQHRHCEPTGRCECAPDDWLREAIHRAALRRNRLLPPSLGARRTSRRYRSSQ